MFGTVLVANRGEIAVRIIGTLRRLGVTSIAVHSDADAGAPHTVVADRALRIGPAAAAESYLSIAAIVEAAVRSGAEAVHPGYGFLSENPEFARACADSGLVFVGPPPHVISAMGDKAQARELALGAGVPVVPGLHGSDLSAAQIAAFCDDHGYPIMVKAVAGGGGKGMRVVRSSEELAPALAAARREAQAAFGDPRVFVERLVERPRHIEVQVLADRHGSVIHLGERECSLQRRHQKVIEEAPSPSLDPALRERLGEAAVRLTRACGYEGAGTIEFLVPDTPPGEFFFLEMNTRLQVEHPVTEAVTGLDLVELQLRIAANEPLPLAQRDISPRGHAIEARIYAEDAEAGFLPATGRFLAWQEPVGEGLRFDSGVFEGSIVTTDYDPLLAKVVAHGADRASALELLERGLSQLVSVGVETNQGFLRRLLARPEVREGRLDTGLLERVGPELAAEPASEIDSALSLVLVDRLEALEKHALSTSVPFGWRLGAAETRWRTRLRDRHDADVEVVATGDGDTVSIDAGGAQRTGSARRIDDRWFDVVLDGHTRRCLIARDGERSWIWRDGAARAFGTSSRDRGAGGDQQDALEAPMPGMVIAVESANGRLVAAGDVLVVLESMKMELPIAAPHAGVVGDLDIAVGDRVLLGQRLATVTEGERT